ncbi:DUF1573 domain-containing protein [Flavimarina sp. Hel_I_48]|uniref:DUF1573 domain-containing protein n=1 Tax=Flavimarina sp. Hel_I_48 TaxID=1392488 RepID=UPI0004DF181E|nr:DUF1573 domain-containing protein [Flavimarina sp. Hel_I_48]
MKKYVILLFLGIWGVALQAQDKKAEINFETDVIDYGEIAHGADGLREFKFTNTGSAPLIISKAYSTCGCTVPTPPKDPIMPGDSGVIKVKYNTKLAGGPIRKTITVYTNASSEPHTLKIKGTLLPEKGAMEKEQSGPINQ